MLASGVEDLLEQAPLALCVLRGPGAVVEALNPLALELLQGRLQVGQALRATLPEPAAQVWLDAVDKVFATGQPQRDAERRIVLDTADGPRERFFIVTHDPLTAADGEITGVLSGAVEITEQVQARQRGEWLATVSQELLEASLEQSDVLQRAARLAVPQLGELCVINQLQPDGLLRRAAVVHTDPAAAAAVAALYRTPPGAESPARRVLDSGGPEILAELDGMRLDELVPHDVAGREAVRELGMAATLIVALQARGRTLGTLSVSSTRPGRYGDTETELARALAVRASLALDTAALYGSERAARGVAEAARSRIAGLQRVTAALSGALTISAVADVVIAEGAGLLEADSATVMVSTGTGLEIVASTGWDSELIDRYRYTAIRPGTPAGDAIKDGVPIWLESAQHWHARYPESSSIHASGGHQACATIPLRLAERTLGVLMFGFVQARALGEDDRSYLLALGDQCAQALDRAQLHAAERGARREAERQRDRMAFLAEASLVLDAPLSSTERLQRLADLAVPRIADWCAVHLGRGEVVDLVAVAHSDPSKVVHVTELAERYPPDPDASLGAHHVMRTGQAELTAEIPDELLAELAADETHFELIRGLGMTSAMVVPLSVRGRTFGAISLVAAESGQHFDDSDLAFALDLANRAALAADNARLYEGQRTVAATLQQALLPAGLPSIEGVQMAARYLAAGDNTNEVGGDLYDVFELGGDTGDPPRCALLIGDVCGKGAVAAALTALVRHTVRAEASHQPAPFEVLGRLNQAILRQLGPTEARFCTVIYGVLTVAAGGVTIMTGCAGHLPPRVLRHDGLVERAPGGGTVLGVFADPPVAPGEFDLGPGDALVLFTDGVTEARSPQGFYGVERLDALLASCAGLTADDIADTIAEDVLGFQMGSPSDDMAVLVIRAAPDREA